MSAKYTAREALTTGISSATINAAAGYLGSEIDNRSENAKGSLLADAELAFTPNASSVANEVLLLYLLEAIDDTNYEDGGSSTQPKKMPAALFPTRDSAAAEKVTCRVALPAGKFKPLVWNAMTGQATSVTLKLYSTTINPAAT